MGNLSREMDKAYYNTFGKLSEKTQACKVLSPEPITKEKLEIAISKIENEIKNKQDNLDDESICS